MLPIPPINDALNRGYLRSAVRHDGPELSMRDVESWLAAQSAEQRMTVERVPLRAMRDWVIGGSPLAVLVKLVLLSVLIGVVLSALGLDPRDIFQSLRRFIQNIWDMGFDAIKWLWQYFLLGAVLVMAVLSSL